MSYDRFIEAYAEDAGMTPAALLKSTKLAFVVSTNTRGQAFVDFLQKTLKTPLKGMRVLDVGCAYGGLSLALHNAGAKVTGIDVSPKFLKYARHNVEGIADIPFVRADASAAEVRRLFEPASFDLVVINDVLEHIYDTASLFENLDHLLSRKGIVYFKVPNGLSPRWAVSEGHRKIFALTLMDPDTWQWLYPRRASIFYRPLSHFLGLFQWFGLPKVVFIDHEGRLERTPITRILGQMDDLAAAAEAFDYPHDQARGYIRGQVERFQDRFVLDRERRSDAYMRFVYGSSFFVGFAARKWAPLKLSTPIDNVEGLGRIARPLPKEPAA